jgi:hypothetical protein
MIKINLLPVEKRKAEHTPLPRFLLLAGTAAAAVVLGFVNFWIYMQIRNVQRQIEDNQATIERLKPDAAEHDRLQLRVTALTNKIREIESLVNREVEQWRAVDAVWTVIHNNPKVWIDDVRVLDAAAASGELRRVNPDSKDGSPYGITMRCHVAGSDVEEMTKFRKGLKEHPVLQEFLGVINFNVDWRVDSEKDYTEDSSIGFQISLLGPVKPPQKVKPGAKPGAPAPQGGTKK